jgi:type IV pilus assembly protein PilE
LGGKKMKRQTGFTLIELMIVVAIIGIIASYAFPSYVESVRKANRAEAKSLMLQVANQQERYYTENNAYGALTAIGNTTASLATDSGRHNITVTLSNSDANYIITATPVETDPTCGNLTLSNTGAQASSVVNASCW